MMHVFRAAIFWLNPRQLSVQTCNLAYVRGVIFNHIIIRSSSLMDCWTAAWVADSGYGIPLLYMAFSRFFSVWHSGGLHLDASIHVRNVLDACINSFVNILRFAIRWIPAFRTNFTYVFE